MYVEMGKGDRAPLVRDEDRQPLHGAILILNRSMFQRMLNLPADVHVVAVYEDALRGALVLHLVGDSLPQVPNDGREASHATLMVQSRREDDGVWWQRCQFDVSE